MKDGPVPAIVEFMTYQELYKAMKTAAGRRVAQAYVVIYGPRVEVPQNHIEHVIAIEEKAVQGIPEEAHA